MTSVDVLFRVLTIVFLLFRDWYWWSTGKKADREKPKAKVRNIRGEIELWVIRAGWFFSFSRVILFSRLFFPVGARFPHK